MLNSTLAAACVAFAAGFLQGMAGFGLNQLAVPLLLLLLPPAQAILAVLLLDIPVCLILLWRLRHLARPATVWPLLLGVAAGSVPGALLLTRLPERALRLFISGVLSLLALLGLFGVRRRLGGHPTVVTAAAGLIAGALNASAGVAGPPLILFLVNQETEAGELRATLQAAFLLASAMALLVVARQPALLLAPLRWALWLLVPAMLGLWAGSRVNLRTATLHRFGLLLVLGSSLVALGSALFGS